MSGRNFETFKDTVERRLMRHPVVVDNPYTAWFAEGRVPLDHLRHFTVQFSVFSNQFLLAALNRVINADTLEAARESKGDPDERARRHLRQRESAPVPGRGPSTRTARAIRPCWWRPREPSTAGRFRFQAAHFEWLLRFGAVLGLRFADMGKRRHGDPEHAVLLRRAVPALRQAVTTTRRWAPRSPSRTGPRPVSGRS